ncbi:MAG TPA: hypothetical protein VEZ20_03595 [Allosphingosinicella sp.]|nr:hypothetical protein [Allosphingosinicella sp.]
MPLMLRALDAARAEADAARADRRLHPEDRGDFQTQYARVLGHVRWCDAAAAFIVERPEIMATGIERAIYDAQLRGDRQCALKLAPVMLERRAGTRYIPAGQIGLKFRAGAYLDAGGIAEGQAIMRGADAELAGAERSSVREPRFAALGAYHGTERLMPYLEYLADRMIADRHLVPSGTRNGIFAIFAFRDRCDLIARVDGPEPTRCEEAKKHARAMYIDPPSASEIASARNMQTVFGFEDIGTDEEGLRTALAITPAGMRMTHLLVFVSDARLALQAAETR